MIVFHWNPAWETGIERIDHQHRYLLKQMNGLIDAIYEQNPQGQLSSMLNLLSAYVDLHFREEEAEMEATGYGGLAAHRAIHDGMRRRVADLVIDCQRDEKVLTEAVLEFLVDWLINHIGGEDRLLAEHLKHCDARRIADGDAPAQGGSAFQL
jgi:hemerythrin-like metal-binding protein